MANYQHKRSSVAGKTPLAGDLLEGEIAVNIKDRKLFAKDDQGAVFEFLGGNSRSVETINNVSPIEGNVTLDALNIPPTADRLWMSQAERLKLSRIEEGTGTGTNIVTSVAGKIGDVELNLSDIKVNGGTANNVVKAQLIAQGLSGNYGFFEKGFNYSVEGDIGIDADGNSWTYVGIGAPNKVVTAGTVPSAPDYKRVVFNANGDTSGGVDRESTRLYLADYVEDPQDVASVDAGIEEINAKISHGMTVDLSGDYVWPSIALNTSSVNRLKITGGSFTRTSAGVGVEYIIRVQFSNATLICGITLDGASIGTHWGSQGIYVSRSQNTIIAENHFKDIGDGVIRYAYKPQSANGNPVTSTDGLVIIGNTFENCQQVTSNSTGGKNVVISANSFINSAIKVTQAVPSESGWTIITDNNFRDSVLDAPVTMQGGSNLVMDNNTIDNCKGLFSFSPNNGPLYGDNIVNSNIYITNNKCRTKLGDRMIYGEVRGGQAPNSVLPINGDIVIKGNVFDRLDGYTESLNNTIGLYNYVPNSYIGKNIIIEDNEFIGDHRTLIQFGGDGAQYLHEQGMLSIRNNRGKSIYEALFVNVEATVAGKGRVYIEDNNVVCPQFMSGNFFYTNGALEVYSVKDNTIEIVNTGGIFTTQLGLTYTAKTPIALTTIVDNNRFYYLDSTGDGTTIGLGAPRVSDVGDYQLVMKDNVIVTKDGSQGIRPLYVRTNADSKPFASLVFSNNIAELDPVDNTLSHDSNVPASLLHFINKDSTMVQLISTQSTKDGNYFTSRKEWSDGRQVQTGFTKLSFDAPASGNIYLNPAAPNEDYTVQITPRHNVPLLHTVQLQSNNLFQPRFSDIAGNDVTPEFNYTAEWYN